MIAPKFAELSSKYPTVTFLKVNVDELEVSHAYHADTVTLA